MSVFASPPRSVSVTESDDAVVVSAAAYAMRIERRRPFAELFDASGVRWARLALLVGIDATDGRDATYPDGEAGVERGADDSALIVIPSRSLRWGRRELRLRFHPDAIHLAATVRGQGAIDAVTLLGGSQAGFGSWASGERRSAFDAGAIVSGSPSDPRRLALPISEGAAVGADGAGHAGGGRWFFTPGPLCFALARGAPEAAPEGLGGLPDGPWLTLGVGPRLAAATFVSASYEPVDGAAQVRLAYDGQTSVDGAFETPELRIGFASDPYVGMADHRAALERDGLAPGPRTEPVPDWWTEPIWCGWGAQCHEARASGVSPQALATAERYDAWLASLERRGIVPGTVVVDDGWQGRYGTNETDRARWPDLAGWVAGRHRARQRVLLWWKAWDPGGLAVDACVTTAAGIPIAVDPTSSAYRELVARSVERVLGPAERGGMNVDGLKLDFTAHTPSGPGLRRAGSAWGIELLLSLVELIADAARSVKPDALIVAHTPNPLFRRAVGMIRLNDALRLDDREQPTDVVPGMRHRAAIARAACPELPIDTDDWAMPSLAAWRRYQAAKPRLGVPALYAVDAVDPTGELLTPEDDALVRASWRAWRDRPR